MKVTDVIGSESIYTSDEWVGATVKQAYRDSAAWIRAHASGGDSGDIDASDRDAGHSDASDRDAGHSDASDRDAGH